MPGPAGATELATQESSGGDGPSREAVAQLFLPDDRRIAYARRHGRPGAGRAALVFLGGFRSDMAGSKAAFLDAHCAANGLGLLRFDYSGHGQSGGAFTDGTIGRWAAEAIALIDAQTEGKLVLVGSSMGGWIMLLAALARPQRVAGLIGIAAAPDFTETLIWDRLDAASRARLERDGKLVEDSQYSDDPTIITRGLIEEGRRHLLLAAPIGIHCPVRLLHGMADPDVPYQVSLQLAERLETDDVRVTLVKDGDHRLSREQDLALLGQAVDELAG